MNEVESAVDVQKASRRNMQKCAQQSCCQLKYQAKVTGGDIGSWSLSECEETTVSARQCEYKVITGEPLKNQTEEVCINTLIDIKTDYLTKGQQIK